MSDAYNLDLRTFLFSFAMRAFFRHKLYATNLVQVFLPVLRLTLVALV